MSKNKTRPSLPHSGLPEAAPKALPVRHSGHLVDQKFHSSLDSTFDRLSPSDRNKVETHDIKVVGLSLSVAQDKMVHVLYLLLRENSEHRDAQSDFFYKGNVRSTGDDVVMRITRAAIYKAYTGNNRYSGKAMQEIDETLRTLSEHRYLVRYQRQWWEEESKKGKKRTKAKRIDQVQKILRLFSLAEVDMGLTPKELEKINRGERGKDRGRKSWVEITFNRLFTDQISSKYIEYPADINQRMAVAAGSSKRVTSAMTKLRDYLLRDKSYKHKKVELNENKLPLVLGLDDYVQAGRKALVKRRVDEAIQACGRLGLYKAHSVVRGSQGQLKHVFELDHDFE